MKIGIEAQRLFRKRKFGMDIVILELIRQLQVLDRENEYVIFVNPDKDVCIQETANFKIHYISSTIYPVWEQLLLPKAVRQTKVDFLHCTSNTAPLRLNVPLVLTLHDVISLEPTAKYFMSLYQETGRIYRRWLIPKVASRCSRLITVTHNEKKLISKKIPKTKSKISVVHNGVDKRFRPISETGKEIFRNKYQLPEKYMAFLGNTDPRKNIHDVLLAYSVYLKQSKYRIPLVILHFERNKLMSLLRMLKIKEIESHVITIGYLDFDEMPAFYSAAELFLFPSLREGFGMPILEAMACGTPVITSVISSMPEVAGNAGWFVDPSDVDEIALNILHLEDYPEEIEDLREKGLQRSREFSWEKAARNLLKIYQNEMKKIKKLTPLPYDRLPSDSAENSFH